ncbi:MAG: ATP-dependent RecD-like DNA helicase [Syntrophobacteraceae bacterium]
MAVTIQGLVERITYANEENGYHVIQVKVSGRKDLVTAVGNFGAVTPGEALRMEGIFESHARYGQQFKVDRYETSAPATLEGIRKYLGSGLIKGIGPVMAKRIVGRFGEATLDIIENEGERLLEVEGIGPVRIAQIRKAWQDQKEIRDLMLFLQGHGVSSAYATRIFKRYGVGSKAIVGENPYRLAMDITGIGFLTADKIAQKLGFAPDSPLRAEAGLLFALHESVGEGHVCLPRGLLMEQAAQLLSIPDATLVAALESLLAQDLVVRETAPVSPGDAGDDLAHVYLKGYFLAEKQAARRLLTLLAHRPLQRRIDVDQSIAWLKTKMPFKLAPLQEEAVRQSLKEKVIVITGGPGTGKTTLIRAVLAIYRQLGAQVCLAAPTGRAAKRLNEATRYPASTLHRLLELSPQQGRFMRDEYRPLAADLIIVDECSMLDVLLVHHLLKAVPGHATLVLVGDVDQLPSVGPGNVLKDIIGSGRFPVVRLAEIFRQARQSQIVVNAHLIQQGKFPRLQPPDESAGDALQDFYFIEKEDPEEVVRVILRLCTERIPARFGLDPVEEVQILSPMHRGLVGAQHLNSSLQEALNPSGKPIERGGRLFRVGDKVMQIRNNYDKDVFNGDWGRIRDLDLEAQELAVEFDGRTVAYDFSELDELQLAYAVSVHKAQGSEYPAIIMPLLTQHYVMLQRNLLYTAITRARKLAVVVGTKKALAIAVRNDRMLHRHTLLRERLVGTIE